MNDWLDELLYRLPSEPIPDRLIRQVRLRLAQARRSDRRRRRLVGWFAGVVGALGAAWLIQGLQGRIGSVVQPTPADLAAALAAASASPTQALMELAAGVLGRVGGLETWFILAVSLLAFPALYAASRMLFSEPAHGGAMS